MSQHNYLGLSVKAQMDKDPSVLTVTDGDITRIEQQQAKRRAQQDKENSPTKADLRKEYNQLRQKLFDLKNDAKCYETRTNDAQGQIELIEQRINNALKLKKAAVAQGNLRGERTYEQAIERLEPELAGAKEEFNKNKHWSAQAAHALKAFDGHARIEELKAILDAPLPDAKSVNVPK